MLALYLPGKKRFMPHVFPKSLILCTLYLNLNKSTLATIRTSETRRAYSLFLCLPTQKCRTKNRLVFSEPAYHKLGFLQNVKPQGGKMQDVFFFFFFVFREKNQGQVLLHKQTRFEARAESNSRPFKKKKEKKKPYAVWIRIIKRKRGESWQQESKT